MTMAPAACRSRDGVEDVGRHMLYIVPKGGRSFGEVLLFSG